MGQGDLTHVPELWKIEYAVAGPDGREVDWFDSKGDAYALAEVEAQGQRTVYTVVEVKRYSDDRATIYTADYRENQET